MKFVLHLICLCVSVTCFSQHVYWVSFTHKDSAFSVSQPRAFLSEKAIARRAKYNITIDASDLPVSSRMMDVLKNNGCKILTKSKWQNAVAVLVPQQTYADTLRQFTFVKNAVYLGQHQPVKSSRSAAVELAEKSPAAKSADGNQHIDSVFYGKTYSQVNMINLQQLHKLGFKGNNIDIAVIDAGFCNADKLPVFKHLLDSHRIKSTVDFVQKDDHVYDDDDHGMSVLSCMAGYLPYQYVGTAPFANYFLLRSEYSTTEMPIEETNWLEAAEYADSCGVDMINSSLGYNEFDQPFLNHKHKDLDGETTIISHGAAMAVSKGIIVVNSAGNEGTDPWLHISVPADVADVITVGGVDAWRRYAVFSSIGASVNKNIKPDIMAQGDNAWVASSRGTFYAGDGTSYSCPIMTGAIACLLEAHYDKSPAQMMQVLHLSGDRYNRSDKFYGYGVPDIYLAHLMLINDQPVEETLLDCRPLSDKNIHLSFATPVAQKITVVLKNTADETVVKETISLKKKGIHRFALKKAKKLPKGVYTLQIQTKGKLITQQFIYP
jgi:serine protease AprX